MVSESANAGPDAPALRRSHQLSKQRDGAFTDLWRGSTPAATHTEGHVERRSALAILDIQPGAVLDQEPDEGVFPSRDGEMQRRLPGVVGRVDVGARLEAQAGRLENLGLRRAPLFVLGESSRATE